MSSRDPGPHRRRRPRHAIARRALVPLAYLIAVITMTWPLGAHVATHLPSGCRADCLLTAWVLAHESEALAVAPTTFADGGMYHPTPHALFYATTAPGALPLFAPAFLWTGNPALALNVLFLAGLTLSAWATHAVVRRWTGSDLAGVVAAVTLLTARWNTTWAVRAPFYALLAYMPLVAYVAARVRVRPAAAVLLAVLVAAQTSVDPVYCALAVGLPLATLAALWTCRRDTRRAALLLVGAMGVAVLPLLPIYAGYAEVVRANPDLLRQTVWPRKAWLSHPPAEWFGWRQLSPVFPLAAVAVVGTGLVSVLARLWRREPIPAAGAWAHGFLWTAVGLLAATSLRSRVGMAALVGGAILVGAGFSELLTRLHALARGRPLRHAVAALLCLAVSAALVSHHAPTRWHLRLPPAQASGVIVRVLRAGSGPVLEVPMRHRRDHARHVEAMYRSIFHGRPVLNGYSSYHPADFPARMQLAQRLPRPGALARLRATTGVTTIVVHRSQTTRDAWAAAARGRRPDLRLLWQGGGRRVFDVIADGPVPPGARRTTGGTAAGRSPRASGPARAGATVR